MKYLNLYKTVPEKLLRHYRSRQECVKPITGTKNMLIQQSGNFQKQMKEVKQEQCLICKGGMRGKKKEGFKFTSN